MARTAASLAGQEPAGREKGARGRGKGGQPTPEPGARQSPLGRGARVGQAALRPLGPAGCSS
eukprot:3555005-Lingulodinium_polyedra.AAC.1